MTSLRLTTDSAQSTIRVRGRGWAIVGGMRGRRTGSSRLLALLRKGRKRRVVKVVDVVRCSPSVARHLWRLVVEERFRRQCECCVTGAHSELGCNAVAESGSGRGCRLPAMKVKIRLDVKKKKRIGEELGRESGVAG